VDILSSPDNEICFCSDYVRSLYSEIVASDLPASDNKTCDGFSTLSMIERAAFNFISTGNPYSRIVKGKFGMETS
jgi:hypothetical protein